MNHGKFTDEEWSDILGQTYSKGKLIQVVQKNELTEAVVAQRELAKMLLAASNSFVLFAQPNELGTVFTISTLHEAEEGNVGKFALNFALSGNRLLYEIGLAAFHGQAN